MLPGTAFRVSAGVAAEMTEHGLARMHNGGAVADSDNLFDAAIARADETIRGYMGTSATMTSGELSGAVIRGVFDDPENISYAGQGVR